MRYKKRLLLSCILTIVCCGISWSTTQSCILYKDTYAFNQGIEDFMQTDSILPNDLVETAIHRIEKDLARGADVYPQEIRAIYVCINQDCRLNSMYMDLYVDDSACPFKQISGNEYRFQLVQINVEFDEDKVVATSGIGEYITRQLPKWNDIPVKVDKALEIALEKTQGVYVNEPFRLFEVLIVDSWYIDLHSEDVASNTENLHLQINYADGTIVNQQWYKTQNQIRNDTLSE